MWYYVGVTCMSVMKDVLQFSIVISCCVLLYTASITLRLLSERFIFILIDFPNHLNQSKMFPFLPKCYKYMGIKFSLMLLDIKITFQENILLFFFFFVQIVLYLLSLLSNSFFPNCSHFYYHSFPWEVSFYNDILGDLLLFLTL